MRLGRVGARRLPAAQLDGDAGRVAGPVERDQDVVLAALDDRRARRRREGRARRVLVELEVVVHRSACQFAGEGEVQEEVVGLRVGITPGGEDVRLVVRGVACEAPVLRLLLLRTAVEDIQARRRVVVDQRRAAAGTEAAVGDDLLPVIAARSTREVALVAVGALEARERQRREHRAGTALVGGMGRRGTENGERERCKRDEECRRGTSSSG